MGNPELTPIAYTKIILHALKYPHRAVVGLLIGGIESSNELFCMDAVPVLHEVAALGTVLEAALTSIDAHCSRNSMHIIGVYFCNEALSDDSLDMFAVRVADKVASNFADAILIQIDNSLLSIDSSEPAVRIFSSDNKTWKPKKFRLESEEATLGAVSIAIQTKLYRELIDFENHLDNPANDYWNCVLNQKIEQLAGHLNQAR